MNPEEMRIGAMSNVIAENPPNDGRRWECHCARCASSMEFEDCGSCGGEGITGPGELHEQDPLWYDEGDYEICHQCGGAGGWLLCMARAEWCNRHPLPGRIEIASSTTEWFCVEPMTEAAK